MSPVNMHEPESAGWPSRWFLQREHPHHEPPSYFIEGMTRAEEQASIELGIDTWSTRRMTTIRRANRLAAALKAAREEA